MSRNYSQRSDRLWACPDCGVLIDVCSTHDAWHAAQERVGGRLPPLLYVPPAVSTALGWIAGQDAPAPASSVHCYSADEVDALVTAALEEAKRLVGELPDTTPTGYSRGSGSVSRLGVRAILDSLMPREGGGPGYTKDNDGVVKLDVRPAASECAHCGGKDPYCDAYADVQDGLPGDGPIRCEAPALVHLCEHHASRRATPPACEACGKPIEPSCLCRACGDALVLANAKPAASELVEAARALVTALESWDRAKLDPIKTAIPEQAIVAEKLVRLRVALAKLAREK